MAEIRVLGLRRKIQTAFSRTGHVLSALKVHESLFALPFTYTGMLIAAKGFPSIGKVLWITLAMLGARNFGMALNRVIDRKIDAMHPLHRERHVPSGQIRVWEMMVFSSIALALFLVSAWKLNPLAFILAFPAAAYVVGYSYAKRFTWIANLLLGGALAIGPAGAWVGVTGSLSWQALLLSGAVAMWAGAFDMIYHLPSREFYLEHGLHSIPQRFGVKATRIWARVYDACAVVALFILGLWVGLNVVYFIGLMSAAAILAYKHRILSRQDAVRPGKGFFKYNAMVSASVFAFTVLAFIV